MEVTVKMYPEEYDLFREYQREKASLEREMSADYDRLCEKHGNLCKKILDATTVSEATIYAEDRHTRRRARPGRQKSRNRRNRRLFPPPRQSREY